jgi:hypothetical protein
MGVKVDDMVCAGSKFAVQLRVFLTRDQSRGKKFIV